MTATNFENTCAMIALGAGTGLLCAALGWQAGLGMGLLVFALAKVIK